MVCQGVLRGSDRFLLNPVNVYGYEYLAQTLKAALRHNVISAEDLLKTDQEVLDILHAAKNKEVLNLLQHIHPRIQVKEDNIQYDFHQKRRKCASSTHPFFIMTNGSKPQLYPKTSEKWERPLIKEQKRCVYKSVTSLIAA